MNKLLLASLFISFSSFAQSPCESRAKDIVREYNQNGKKVSSYEVKNCSNMTSDMHSIMNANSNTNAPSVYSTSACAIIIKTGAISIPELAVIDEENNFELIRDFYRQDTETISPSMFGNNKTGTILYIKSQGDYVDEDGFLNSTKYISRVNYDLKKNKMQILKWKLGWFSNKYSHDYTVSCK